MPATTLHGGQPGCVIISAATAINRRIVDRSPPLRREPRGSERASGGPRGRAFPFPTAQRLAFGFDPTGARPDMDLWRPVEKHRLKAIAGAAGIGALHRQRAMVDTAPAAGACQGRVLALLPCAAPAQQEGIAVPFAGFGSAQALRGGLAERKQDMRMVVARIFRFFRYRFMYRQIRDHAATHKMLEDEPSRELGSRRGGQFMGQGKVDLAGKLGVTPALDHLDVIPEPFAVPQPGRGTRRSQDLRMDHAPPPREIGDTAAGGIPQTGPCPVSGHGDDIARRAIVAAAKRRPADDLRTEMIRCHAMTSVPAKRQVVLK